MAALNREVVECSENIRQRFGYTKPPKPHILREEEYGRAGFLQHRPTSKIKIVIDTLKVLKRWEELVNDGLSCSFAKI